MARLLVVYDLETTGIDVIHDRIAQLGALICREEEAPQRGPGKIDDAAVTWKRFMSYVNPAPRRMSPMASRVTGIDDDTLLRAPPFERVWHNFLEQLVTVAAGAPVASVCLVGHNSRLFDDLMLAAEIERLGLAWPCTVRCGDTLTAARAAGGKKALGTDDLKLGTLYAAATGKPLTDAHDALADCEAAAALLGWRPLRCHLALEPWKQRCATLLERQRKRGFVPRPVPPVVAATPPPEADLSQADLSQADLPQADLPPPPDSLPPPPDSLPPPPVSPSPGKSSCVTCAQCRVCYSVYFSHICKVRLP